MDNQRLLTWALFGTMAWLTYQAWMLDYGPQPAGVAETTAEPAGVQPDDGLPELLDPSTDAPDVLPAIDAPADTGPGTSSPTIRVETDVFQIEISTEGGTLQRAALVNYPVAKDRPDEPVELLNPDVNDLGLIQSGLRSAGDGAEANHRAVFTSAQRDFAMGSNDELLVALRWTDGAGIAVEKRYRFRRGSYTIVIEQELVNGSDQVWRGAEYAQLQRRFFEQKRSMFDVDSYSFDGPIVFDGEKSEKLKYGDLQDDGPFAMAAERGWFGAIQHHKARDYRPDAHDLFGWARV